MSLYCIGSVVFPTELGLQTGSGLDALGAGICGGTSSPGVIYSRACDDARKESSDELAERSPAESYPTMGLMTRLKLNLGDDSQDPLSPHRTCRC